MSIARFSLVVGLILLGACSGCGKDKGLQPRFKPEELENIIDVHPDTTIEVEDKTTQLRDHWAQEELKHQCASQIA